MSHYDIQDGNYVWHSNADRAHIIGPDLAILLDISAGIVLTHGVPAIVAERYRALYRAFEKLGAEDHLLYISGAIPLDKINNALETTGSCRRIFSAEIKSTLTMSPVSV